MTRTRKRVHAALATGLLAAGAITLLAASPATAVDTAAECVDSHADEHSAARGLPGSSGHDRNEVSEAQAAAMNADLRGRSRRPTRAVSQPSWAATSSARSSSRW